MIAIRSRRAWWRPKKLTPKVAERAVEAARAGANMENIAGSAGIHRATLARWIARASARTPSPVMRLLRHAWPALRLNW